MALTSGPTPGGYPGPTLTGMSSGMIALILGILVLPSCTYELQEEGVAEAVEGKNRFDRAGLILSMVGVTALVYGINRACTEGWGDQVVLTALLVSAVVVAAFVIVELIVSGPVLDLRLFQSYALTISSIIFWVAAAALFGGCSFSRSPLQRPFSWH